VYHDSEIGYLCELLNANYLNQNDEFIISGQHRSPFTDQNVVKVITSSASPSNLRFIPAAIFQKFTNLQSIDFTNAGVESLDGIENCLKLESIYLNHNAINKLSSGAFEKCENLKSISIESNGLSVIDVDAFKNLSKLQTLALKNNSIAKLIPKTFDLLPELQSISLQSNYIDEIPSSLFDSLPKLETIHLEYNRVKEIYGGAFRNLSDLTNLYLHNNSISELRTNSFSKMLKTSTLRIDSNNLTAIQESFFENFPNLQSLRAQGNVCIDRDLSPQTDENFLTFFDECFANWNENNGITTTPDGASVINSTFFLISSVLLLSQLI
jgi:Leucine-rich repeat (LRR) protein